MHETTSAQPTVQDVAASLDFRLTPRKNALLLFTKPPVAGLVKTRLSTLKDGIFTPEIAAWLYHCMLFDVVEICCDALASLETSSCDGTTDTPNKPHDVYDLIISTTPRTNVDVMRKLFDDAGTWPRELTIICDEGASFDEHYNDSFSQVWERGYDTVLSMGADMPSLTKPLIREGFERLHELMDEPRGGIVISPDQAMGVSAIGWTRDTPMDHTGIYYNRDGMTVLPAYVDKARALELPLVYLPAVVDVDTMGDLMHNATLVKAIEYCAPWSDLTVPRRTIDALAYLGWDDIRVPPNDLHDPREQIDIPAQKDEDATDVSTKASDEASIV